MGIEALKYGAGLALGIAGIAGLSAVTAKCCTEAKKSSNEHARYVMEHPNEYQEYKNIEKFKALQDENARLTEEIRTATATMSSYRRSYDSAMRRLKAYVEKDIEGLERTRTDLDAYFGRENE